MELLLFFAGLCAICLVFFGLTVLILRSMTASIAAGVSELARAQGEAQAKALAAIQEKVYQDLAGFFEPAAAGEASEFDRSLAGMGAVVAEQIVTKLKMAAIGSAGGSAERTKKGGGIGNLLLSYLAGGSAGGLTSLIGAGQGPGPEDPGNNHKSQSSSKMGM